VSGESALHAQPDVELVFADVLQSLPGGMNRRAQLKLSWHFSLWLLLPYSSKAALAKQPARNCQKPDDDCGNKTA
jgi:hypothetical protein